MTAMLALVLAACGAGSKTEQTTGNGSAAAPATSSEAAPQSTEELSIKHKLGETKVKKNPQKVVVFDFGALDSLDKMGIEVTALPKSNIPPYLEKYKADKYINVGSLKEPDFEKINEVAPDLIIISGRQAEMYDELSKIGPTIYIGVENDKYIESFTENMKTLGKIFGKESFIDEQLAKINEDIKAIHAKAAALNKTALIILANEGSISAYGEKSRFGIIHDVFGIPAVDKTIEVSTHGQKITSEYIVEKNPDYLYVIDRGAAVATTSEAQSAAKQVVENELVKKTKAYQNNHLVYLDQNYWYLSGGGLISIEEMIKEISASLE